MAAFTFTDPVAQVLIKNPTTTDEWFFEAPENPFLTSASIIYDQERMARVEAGFDIPYQDAIDRFLVPPSPFAVNNIMQVRIGYASGLWTPWATGALKAGGDGLSIDSNGVTGTVSTDSVAHSAFFTVGRDCPDGGTFLEQMKYVAEYMGLKLGLTPNAIAQLDTRSPIVVRSWTVWELLKDICAQTQTRWFIGASALASEIISTDRATGRGLLIYTVADWDDIIAFDDTVRTYALRGVIDVDKNQYPCFQWSPNETGAALWANMGQVPDAAGAGIQAISTNTDTGEVELDSILPEQQEVKLVGDIATIDPTYDFVVDEGLLEQKHKPPPPFEYKYTDPVVTEPKPEPPLGIYTPLKPGKEGRERRKNLIRHWQLNGNPGQQGSITALGIPFERAGNKCFLAGLGAIFDGPYEIRKITHIYASGSYDMSLEVFRWGAKDKGTPDHRQTSKGQVKE